jgi:hypothetical protein
MPEPEKVICAGTTRKECEETAQYKVMLLNTPGSYSMCKSCAEKTLRTGRQGVPVQSIVLFTSEIPV